MHHSNLVQLVLDNCWMNKGFLSSIWSHSEFEVFLNSTAAALRRVLIQQIGHQPVVMNVDLYEGVIFMLVELDLLLDLRHLLLNLLGSSVEIFLQSLELLLGYRLVHGLPVRLDLLLHHLL